MNREEFMKYSGLIDPMSCGLGGTISLLLIYDFVSYQIKISETS